MEFEELTLAHCVPCSNTSPLNEKEAEEALKPLPAGWALRHDAIQKVFRFRSYLGGLDFAYSVGKIAEEENHHPDMLIGWRRVGVTLSTHSIKGLSQNDFIMASKIELEYRRRLRGAPVPTNPV